MVSTEKFLNVCHNAILQYYSNQDKTCKDTHVVWYSKSIQNHKCTMIGVYPDNIYFEFTYNGDKNEVYMDVYEKIDKIVGTLE